MCSSDLTMQAAMLLGRNSCGYEIDPKFEDVIREGIDELDIDMCNNHIKNRFEAHIEFIENRKASGKEIKHFNETLNCEVMTTQEKEIEFNYLESIKEDNDTGTYTVSYEDHSDLTTLPFMQPFFKKAK